MESVESLAMREENYDRTAVGDTEPFPLTAAQRGLWFAQHLLADVPITIANYLDIRGCLDAELMRYAGRRTARELGAASLRLIEIGGEPHQYIDVEQGDDTVIVDFREHADPESAALEWMLATYAAPVDLTHGRLIKAAMLRIADERTFWYSHVHHIVLDGYGALQFMKRVVSIYTSVCEGREPEDAKAGSLGDVYAGEAAYRDSARFAKDRDYWTSKTRDLPAPPMLAGIAAPPAARATLCGGYLPEATERALSRAVDRLDSAYAPMAVAAVATFLSRMTGTDDVVLSLPVAARTTALLRRSGGMVSNVLPIRVRVGADITVAELVREVQLELTGALRHQRYRAEDIRRDLGAGAARRGFFGPAINIMAYDTEVQLGPLTGEFNVLSTGPVEDLSVDIYPASTGGRSRLVFEGNPHLYPADSLDLLYRRFLHLFAEFLAAAAETSVSDLAIMDAAERSALVPVRGPDPVGLELLPELLRRGVDLVGDAIAMECATSVESALTYRALDECTNSAARALIARGAGPGTAVAVALPRGSASVLALWAVAKTGATYVPIDPQYPSERVAYMLGDSGAAIVITDSAVLQYLPDVLLPRLSSATQWIELDDTLLSGHSTDPVTDADRTASLTEQHVAYLIYTSGSTGTPKGVAVTHAGLSVFAAAARPELGVGVTSRVLRFSSASFDASLFEMIQTFSAGATLVIAPTMIYGGDELTEFLRARRVTHIICAPALLGTVDASALEDLETVVVGGDVCPPDLVERFGRTVTLINSYGPTETTIVVTATDPLTDPRAITIGRPLQGTTALVLDSRLRPVPIGSTGELYLGGPGVARGYHGRSGLTSARFVADPFDADGARLYRTGDTVRWRQRDTVRWRENDTVRWRGDPAVPELEFLGRNDSQVHLHGLRIELGEIDAVLSTTDTVEFSVSAVLERGESVILVSYVTLTPGKFFDEQALRAAAGRFLPAHMVPAMIVELASVPLTPTGKVDRSALPQPRFDATEVAYRAPSTPVETVIADAMAAVLQRDSVGVDQSFFALGGDSIVAIGLVSRAKASGVVFTPRDVFERRTVAGLAEVAVGASEHVVLEELDGGGVGEFPLTPIMASVVESCSASTALDRFYQAVVLTAPADLDLDGLHRTVGAVIDHHDALRSTLTDTGIVISPPGSVDTDSVVSEVCTAARPGSREFGDVLAETGRAFSARLRPREGVVLQVVWVSPVGDSDRIVDTHGIGRIVVIAHHLVIDGVSWRILVPDLAAAWQQVQGKSAVVLAPVATSVRRWSHGLTEVATNADDELSVWSSILQDPSANGPDMPLGSRELDPAIDLGHTREIVTVAVSPEVTGTLLGPVTQAYRGTVDDVLLTALTIACAREGRESILVSVESHGRDEDLLPGADLSRTIGWFTSAHPVRLSLGGIDPEHAYAGGSATASAIKAVKEQLRAIPGRGSGFGLLRHLRSDTAEMLSALPSPQIHYNYLGRIDTDIPDALRGRGWIPDAGFDLNRGSGHDMPVSAVLDVNAVVTDGCLQATFAYPSGVLAADAVERLAQGWTRALDALAAHGRGQNMSGLTPSDVPLVSVDQTAIELWERRFGTLADIWPLAPLQRGLLFHAELTSGGLDVYTAQLVFELGGDIDGARLHRAARRLISRHDALRAAFVRGRDGEALQVIVADPETPWREIDAEPGDLARIAAEERTEPFDMASAPLMRFILVRNDTGASLIVTNHHILFDGWSMPLVVKDLLVLYAADGPIPIPARRYRDHLARLADRDHSTALNRWIREFDGAHEPTLVAGPQQQLRALPGSLPVPLGADLARSLTIVSKDLGVTVNTVVQAAWAIVLSTVLGREDVVFGATVSGRPADLTGVENTVGLFINTLPVRVHLRHGDTTGSLTSRIQDSNVSLLDCHHVGLADIAAAVGSGAVFDTLTVFESYPIDRSALDEDTDIAGMRVLGIDAADSTHYPLTLITVLEPTLQMTLRYAGGIDTAAASSIADRLRRVLTGMTEGRHTLVRDIEVLSDAERTALSTTWNDTAHPVADATLTDMVGRAAAEHPDRRAVVCEGKSLTYANFAARVRCLARYLISVGVGPETVVGVGLERSLDQVVAVHAILETGGAYLPLDPAQPASRTAHVLGAAKPVLILARPDAGLDGSGVTVVDPTALNLSRFGTTPVLSIERRAPLHGGNPAYVLFTSGSTGTPKGVSVSHAAIVNRIAWMQHEYSLNPTDVVLHKTPFTFDVSVWELLWPLTVGAQMVIAEPAGHRDPMYLSRLVADEGVTVAHFVPSMLRMFLRYADAEECASLRLLFASGEALPRSTADATLEKFGAQLHNLYGPTEAAVDVTHHAVVHGRRGAVPIGEPVWNTRVHVLDAGLKLVPVGVPGELHLAGVQLARGYAARPGLTATRFVADPFGSGGRLYRTGDLVTRAADGSLNYLGRNDFQVKLRGQRVELGEIEAALLTTDGVHAAAAAVHDDRLIAYTVGEADSDALASRCAQILPAYMVPSAFVRLDRIPLGSAGKLDRRALPAPEHPVADLVEPDGSVEEKIAQIFCDVLGVDTVGVTHSWFALGGNSLTATQVVARIDAELGGALSVRDLFEAPTVRALASRLQDRPETGRRALGSSITVMPRPERIPLSPAQYRMWLSNRFDPASGAYNIAGAVRLSGGVDLDALSDAVADVVARHEILRTVYPDGADGPQQIVLDEDAARPHVDVAVIGEGALEGALYSLMSTGFDVTATPPVRVSVLQIGESEHVLAVVTHHIAADGWSMNPLARDIMIAYGARVAGSAPSWAPLPVQYADYTLSTLERLGEESDPTSIAAQQIDYWRATLQGLPERLELPTDRRHPAVAGHRGGTVTSTLGPLLVRTIAAVAAQAGASSFMVVHAALAVLLARISGTTEIAVGTPVAGRGDRALDDLVGMFVGTLVLRTEIDLDASFTEVLALVRERDLDAYGHADVPFERLVEVLAPPRSTAHHPLFQVMFSVEDAAPPAVQLPGLRVEPLTSTHAVAKFDLHVAVDLDAASVTFTYATDLFDEPTVAVLAERFRTVLAGVADDPGVLVGDVDLGTADTSVRLHGDPALAPRTLPDLMSAAVLASAGGVAVIADSEQWTYPQLDDSSTRLARTLISRGAGPETYVAIALPRGLHSLLAVWAVAKTGAAFLPIDMTYPADRIVHMLTDSGAALGLTEAASIAALPNHLDWIDIGCADTADANNSLEPITDADRRAPLLPDHPAYLIYTSGTTGSPKAVTVTHRGLANFTADQVDRYLLDNRSRTLHFASPSFDASVLELLLALGAGSTMVIAGTHVLAGQELRAMLAEVTHAFVTPAALATVDPDGLRNLRTVIAAGETCPPSLAATWAPRTRMFNAYGPTETTIVATISGPLDGDADTSVPIGLPGRGVEASVLDSRLHRAPEGSVGELYIGGDGVARGYHDRPGVTATRFVADAGGRRLYRTGDLVRLRNGEIDYLGRSDGQIKIRGFRIELGEIEAVLARLDGIAQAVAAVRRDAVVAYVLLTPQQHVQTDTAATLLAATLLAGARAALPAHMVPRAITIVDAIPLTPSGKVDRRALPEPEFPSREFLAPATAGELTVARVFAEVLCSAVDIAAAAVPVGAEDDFFELGGTSLMATRVVGRINELSRTSLPVRALFENPTVRALALAIDSAERSTLPPLAAEARPDRIPLSYAQMRMWLLNRLDPESAAYNIAFAVRLSGALDIDALHCAVEDVLARHESLRTYFPVSGELPHQVILERGELTLEIVDVEESTLLTTAARTIGRGFDITSAVPIRGCVLRISPTDHVLVLVLHHISGDGLSMTPLARDVALAYTARAHGLAPRWTPLAVQYADYALWQRAALGSDSDPDSPMSQQVRYWRDRLTGVPEVLDLPLDRPRPAVSTHRGAATTFTLPLQTVADARGLARRTGTSLFMVLHAAYSALLARLSASADIAVGTPVAGRGAGSLDDVVGMFVNTLVLRLQVDPARSFTSLLEQAKEANLGALEHSDVPFERVVDAVSPTRSTAHTPLFQTLLAYEPAMPVAVELPSLSITPLDYESGVTRFDLALTFRDVDNGVSGSLRYASDLFDATTAQAFARQFTTLLSAAVADPSHPVGDLKIEQDDTTGHLRGPADAPSRTFAQLIEDAVRCHPDGRALRANGTDHTYRQADSQSNRLARMLLGYGIGPESVVAVALPRSAEQVLTVWAVAKTGATYLPVDPHYPPERIAHMIEDSGAALGVTDGVHRSALPQHLSWLELDDSDIVDDITGAPDHSIDPGELTGPIRLDSAAYMIYTSGSTGVPKGVVVSHSGLANLAASRLEHHRLERHSRVLHNTSPSFDMAIGEMVSALSAAATLVISPSEIIGGVELADFVRSERVSHALMTPSALSSLQPEGLDCLEVLCVGGEACPPDLVARWTGSIGTGSIGEARERVMLNGYGPTEATDISTLGQVRAGERVTLGGPLHGLTARVLDARLHPVPVGVRGELYVAGPALARGYHRRGALNASRFVADPHGRGTRMYRTGDIVARTADGRLVYGGRSDHQVKVRGFRVELGEIDAVLGRHPDVCFAVTLGRPGPSGDTVLVAYVIGDVDPETLRAHARRTLPPYMVPTAVVSIDAVPRTGTGKLDISALPDPVFTGTSVTRPPVSDHEITAAQVFTDVLGIGEIGVHDNFFDLGGNSLSALRVVAALRERTHDIGLATMLTEPTVAAVARHLEAPGGTDGNEFGIVWPLRESGVGAPVFAIHPIVGLSWCYAALTEHLTNPIYGIQTPPITEIPNTLSELARRYVQEIDRIAPNGPVHLLGWSLGGVLAQDIAVHLTRAGREVASLVLLDAHIEQVDDWAEAIPAADLMAGLGLNFDVPSGGTVALADAADLLSAIDTSELIGHERIQALIASAQRHHALLQQHRPSRYSGEALVFTADRGESAGAEQWAAFIAHPVTQGVDVTHWQMTSPTALASMGPRIARHISRHSHISRRSHDHSIDPAGTEHEE